MTPKMFTVENAEGKTRLATTDMKCARRLVMNMGRHGHHGYKVLYWRRNGLAYQVRYDIDNTVRTRKVLSFDEWFKRREHIEKNDRLERVSQESQDADQPANA